MDVIVILPSLTDSNIKTQKISTNILNTTLFKYAALRWLKGHVTCKEALFCEYAALLGALSVKFILSMIGKMVCEVVKRVISERSGL